MRSLARATSLGLLALGVTGCELVFGLDDYARGGSGGSAGSTTTSSGPSSGGSSAEGGAGATGGSGAGTTTTSGGGGAPPEGCQCLPTIPAGWEIFEARAADIGDPPADCVGDRRVVAGTPSAVCECACGETEVACTAATLRCWDGTDCTGAEEAWTPGDSCTALGARRSCTIEEGVPAEPSCAAQGSPGSEEGDAFDLCAATRQEAPGCGSSERCIETSPEGRACIVGQGTCPEGWDLEQHEVSELGTFGCGDCSCGERSCAGATYRMSGDYGAGSSTACLVNVGLDIAGTGCLDVTNPGEGAVGHAKRRAVSVVQGSCDPLEPTTAGIYAPGAEARLCCLPRP